MSTSSKNIPPNLEKLLGEVVVVDTDSSYIFMGRLEALDEQYLQINEVDVHDMGKSNQSKERYIHEARKIGVRHNRKNTFVRMDRVVCISLLDDVVGFTA